MSKFKPTETNRKVRGWFMDPPDNQESFCLLCGPVGTGKTIAAKLASPFHLPIYPFHSAVENWSESPISFNRISSRCFVLDDVGPRGRGRLADPTDVIESLVATVEEFRIGTSRTPWRRARLIMTTNLSPEEFGDWVGGRVVDRVFNHGIVLNLSGESLRGMQTDCGGLITPPLRATDDQRALIMAPFVFSNGEAIRVTSFDHDLIRGVLRVITESWKWNGKMPTKTKGDGMPLSKFMEMIKEATPGKYERTDKSNVIAKP